jgi:branched-chain amino acid transport system ATP-binding protein
MIDISGLHVSHGQIEVLHDLSFSVEQGEIIAVIGANGAGKSTLLGTLAGIYHAGAGQITFQGKTFTNIGAESAVKAGISLVPERRQVFTGLSVYDNLLLGAYHRYRKEKHLIPQEIKGILEMFSILQGREKQAAGTLSGGMQQMLVIGRAMMAKPKFLLLDEPSLGLAPLIVKEIISLVRTLRERGMTVLIVEQNVLAALEVADRVYVMDRGRFAFDGPAASMLADTRVQSAYLGQRRVKRDGA